MSLTRGEAGERQDLAACGIVNLLVTPNFWEKCKASFAEKERNASKKGLGKNDLLV